MAKPKIDRALQQPQSGIHLRWHYMVVSLHCFQLEYLRPTIITQKRKEEYFVVANGAETDKKKSGEGIIGCAAGHAKQEETAVGPR